MGTNLNNMTNPILNQPRRQNNALSSLTAGISNDREDSTKLRGLSPLSITNSIVIETEKKCCSCGCGCGGGNVNYVVKNLHEHENEMFTAVEDRRCCYFSNLQNVIIRDLQKVAVARVCYKEKSCLSGDMAIGIYYPPDVLIASAREISSCFTNSITFKIWDAENEKLFCVKYNQGILHQLCGFSAYFKVMSEETKLEIAEITEKSKERLRIRFKDKLSVTHKIILTGFCLGLIHKSYKQKLSGDDKGDND